jgi:hypothetical protein
MASCNTDIFARRSSRDRLYFYLHVERKLFVNIFMVYLFWRIWWRINGCKSKYKAEKEICLTYCNITMVVSSRGRFGLWIIPCWPCWRLLRWNSCSHRLLLVRSKDKKNQSSMCLACGKRYDSSVNPTANMYFLEITTNICAGKPGA